MLEVLYGCGLRRGELLGLNVGDVNFIEQTLFVDKGKGGKDRLLPIHHAALTAISEYLATRGGRPKKRSPLFVIHQSETAGKRMSRADLEAVFRGLNKRSQKHIYPHLFRHTFACHLLQNGADLRYVQALLGHESPDTTSRYLGLCKADLKKEYDRAVEVILGR